MAKDELTNGQLDGYGLSGNKLKPGRTYVGTAVPLDVPKAVQNRVLAQIEDFTVVNSDVMSVVSLGEIAVDMYSGTTVLRTTDDGELLAFGRLKPDPIDERLIYLKTLISVPNTEYSNGSGTWVIENATELALINRRRFPVAREVYTRVLIGNQGCERLMRRVKAEQIRSEISPDTGRPIAVYDLTHIGLRRTRQ